MTQTSKRIEIISSFLLSILAMIINYAIQILLTPYITNHLGTDAYGFVSLAKTISNYGIVITSCLNAYASRFITVEYCKDNKSKSNAYYSSVVIANFVLLLLVLVFDVIFTIKIECFLNIPNELLYDVKNLFFLDILNYMVLALGNTFSVYAYVKNKLSRLNVVRIISYSVEALILFILMVKIEPQLFYVGIALIVSSSTLFFLNFGLSKKYIYDLEISCKHFSFKAVRELIGAGIWSSINQMGNLLNSGLDLLVSNLMLSAVAMGELSIVKTVSTILSTLAQLFSSPFQPLLLKSYSKNDKEEVVSTLNKQININGFIVCVVLAGVIGVGKSYFRLWTPNENVELLYGIAIVTAVGFVFEGMATPLFYTYTLTLHNRIPCVVTVISGFLNVVGMYCLLKFTSIGLYGVVGTTSVLGMITFGVFTPIYSSHCLGVKRHVFFPSMFKILICSIVLSLMTCLIRLDNYATTWFRFVMISILICLISAIAYFIIVLSNSDKVKIFKYIKNKFIHE